MLEPKDCLYFESKCIGLDCNECALCYQDSATYLELIETERNLYLMLEWPIMHRRKLCNEIELNNIKGLLHDFED